MVKRSSSVALTESPRVKQKSSKNLTSGEIEKENSVNNNSVIVDIDKHFNQFKLPISASNINNKKHNNNDIIAIDSENENEIEIEEINGKSPVAIKSVKGKTPKKRRKKSSPSKSSTTTTSGIRHWSLPPLLPKTELGHPPPYVLVVGSGPSEASLLAQQYYAYKHNHMWPIMGLLLGFDFTIDYEERVNKVISRGIAVWDTLESFEREGSLDSAIRNVRHTDIKGLLDLNPSIKRICCNGGLAYKECKKSVSDGELLERGVERIQMPSSSPAHAMLDAVNKKAAVWRVALMIEQQKGII